MKKIFQVNVTYTACGLVYAENEAEAIQVARANSRRLLEERDGDEGIEVGEYWAFESGQFDSDYLMLDGSMTLEEARSREYADEAKESYYSGLLEDVA